MHDRNDRGAVKPGNHATGGHLKRGICPAARAGGALSPSAMPPMRREISKDAAQVEGSAEELARIRTDAEAGTRISIGIKKAAAREHNRRRQSIADLMMAQQDAAAMERELASLGSRVNNRRLGGEGGGMRDRLQQAQRRTASAFLTSDAMALASQLASLAEQAPSEASDSSSSSDSSASNSSDEEADPDAWKEELRLMAERQEAEDAREAAEAAEAERLLMQQEEERRRWEEEEARADAERRKREAQEVEEAAAAAAVAARLLAEQEKQQAEEERRRAEEAATAEQRRQEELRMQEADRLRRQYEEEEAHKLAEQLRLQEEEQARLRAERAERRRLAREAEELRQLELRQLDGGSALRLSEYRWTPRMRLVQQYARRLQEDADQKSLLPRVSLPPPGHKRNVRSAVAKRHQGGDADWSWVASPRGHHSHKSVESAREHARQHVAAQEGLRAKSERRLNSSLHKYVRGPTRPTGHRYVDPPRASYSFPR